MGITLGVLALYVLWVGSYWRTNKFCESTLSRNVYDLVLKRNDELVQTSDLYSLGARSKDVECPACGEPYVYKPFAAPRRSWESASSQPANRMIAWCPTPSHAGAMDLCPAPWLAGYRNVLLEDGIVIHMAEAEFQDAVKAGYTIDRNVWR
jgi:hypothetical protein